MRPKFSKSREALIDKILAEFIKRTESIERKFFREAVRYLRNELDINGGIVKSTVKNHRVVDGLGIVAKEFQEKEGRTLLGWLARRYIDLSLINRRYFNAIGGVTVTDKVRQKVERNIFAELGISRSKNKIKIADGSFLADAVDFKRAMLRVKQIATQQVSDGQPLSVLNRAIRNYQRSNENTLPTHHLQQAAADTFSIYDRRLGKAYSKELGLRAFIYQGGLIETSREFCEHRNNKVFTLEEAEKWKSMEWNGKWPEDSRYDPMSHMGGARCRHQPDFISDALAIRLRPELKDIWNL